MTKNNSRTINSLYNFISSIGGQFLTIVMQFAVRTVFINTLGKSYLGISGLFSNILSMLSLAEFGVGNAIIFKMYKPLANKDQHRISLLMKFYRKLYTAIGIAVGLIGLVLVPFLPELISDYDKLIALDIKPTLIFIIYLSNSVASYLFFSYKSAIIRADQKEYIINVTNYWFTVGTGIFQIGLLLIYPKFELYVGIHTVSVIVQNIVCAKIADKRYPFIKEKTAEKIDREEEKGIYKDCSALFLYKLNGVVLKATDNIIISGFLGIEAVGMYSNYYIIYSTIEKLFVKIFGSIAHSLGNLHAGKNRKHEHAIFEATIFITAILGGTAGVGVATVSNYFIEAWIGKEWLFAQPFALLMGMEVYTLAFRHVLSKYRTAMGLFQQAKYRPLAGMLINLILSMYLVKKWGICGVLVGTIVADWSTMMWFEPLIIHRHGFENMYSLFDYYRKFILYFVITITVGAFNLLLGKYLMIECIWIKTMVHALICMITVPMVLVGVTFRSKATKYVYNLGIEYLGKFVKRLKK
mgnify:CR=1 FL=1